MTELVSRSLVETSGVVLVATPFVALAVGVVLFLLDRSRRHRSGGAGGAGRASAADGARPQPAPVEKGHP